MKDVIIAPQECKMMEVMQRAGFTKLHPGGKRSTKKLLQLCDIHQNKRVIDIGCGPGDTTIYIAKKYGCHVTGIDILPEMIKKAKENAIKYKVDHLTRFEVLDAMSPAFSDFSFDVAIFQAVLIFGDKQKMLNFTYRVLNDNGLIGANELTWRGNLPREIKETFAEEFAQPLINAETKDDWISIFSKAGFRKVACDEIHSLTIGTFIRMWSGEELINKIRILFKCLYDKVVIQRMFTIIQLLNKYPNNLSYGYYISQKQ